MEEFSPVTATERVLNKCNHYYCYYYYSSLLSLPETARLVKHDSLICHPRPSPQTHVETLADKVTPRK